jgi:hypothetical protein
VTIIEALDDDELFAPVLGDPATWAAWRVLLAALFGLRMTEVERVVYEAHTKRRTPPAAPVREGWLVVGRRGGKSRIAALVAVYLACFRDYGSVLAPGERGTVSIIAADRRQARTVMRYIVGLLEGCPMLVPLVVARTADSIELSNGVVLEVHTASFRAVRGYTVVAAILDEIAFWRSEESANPDREIVNALRPAMATVPGSLLLAISSPYAQRGILWEIYRRHFGQEGDPVLVWQAPTRAMNPAVEETLIDAAYADDPAVAAAEYGAEFRCDIDAFLVRDALEAVVSTGRSELAPVPDQSYFAFVDPSGGARDAMALAIAHAESDHVVLDAVRERRPPFSPDAVVEEFAQLLGAYGIDEVVGDRYAGDWPRERFGAHGIAYLSTTKSKNDLYGALLPMVHSKRVVLLDHPRLLAQLAGLERRTTWGGRDSIDHGPGAHDDLANAAAGALLLAARQGRVPEVRAVVISVPIRRDW